MFHIGLSAPLQQPAILARDTRAVDMSREKAFDDFATPKVWSSKPLLLGSKAYTTFIACGTCGPSRNSVSPHSKQVCPLSRVRTEAFCDQASASEATSTRSKSPYPHRTQKLAECETTQVTCNPVIATCFHFDRNAVMGSQQPGYSSAASAINRLQRCVVTSCFMPAIFHALSVSESRSSFFRRGTWQDREAWRLFSANPNLGAARGTEAYRSDPERPAGAGGGGGLLRCGLMFSTATLPTYCPPLSTHLHHLRMAL